MLKKRSSSSKLALIWLVVVVFFSGLLAKQFLFSAVSPIETNILKLLPENRQNPISEQAFQQVADNMSNQVVFVVSNPDAKQAITAAKSFESKLNKLSLFNEIQGKISKDKQSKWAEFYFNHRAQLLTKAQIDELTTQPQNRVQYVLQSLYNPFLGVTSSELDQDPFLLFRDFLADLTSKSGNFNLVDGYLTTTKSETTHVLITGELKGSPYQLSSQRQLPKLIDIENEVTTQYGGDIIHTGVIFYADYGTQSAKSEVSTIGLGSLIGVVLLILIVFRSALPLSLAILSISSGLLVALAATIAIFGKVHLFSLVFGASLIGVSIDYAFHYLTDRLAAGKHWNSQQGLKHIFIAITLGLVTSLIGYLGLLIAPFPGLQQLALFSAIGLFSAYASVVCWYPILAQSPSQSASMPAEKLWEKWLSLWKKPKFTISLPLLVLLLGVLGLSQATYDDDIRQLQAMPQSLKNQETKIAELSGVSNSQQMLLLTADSEQKLLEKLTLTTDQLQLLANQKIVTGHQSIDQYLPTIERQQLNYRLLTKLYQDQGPALQSTLGWQRTPSLTDFNPISVESFLASQVSEPIRFLWLEQINNQYASVIM
ncbi:MMPL family transporter, partial [Vibrio makurazakiensis]|uniref:MMPL family transporter n=1 Tax=Vibrio makurazakiensis TaxID=2910250 RepID=UPI003D148A84